MGKNNIIFKAFFDFGIADGEGQWAFYSLACCNHHFPTPHSFPLQSILHSLTTSIFLRCNSWHEGLLQFGSNLRFSALSPSSQYPSHTYLTFYPYRTTPCYPNLSKELPLLIKPPPQTSTHSSRHIFNVTFLFISLSGCDHSPFSNMTLSLLFCFV